jgi:mono/diheme cytochrome c family protein
MAINKFLKAGLVVVAAVALFSCGTRRSPGRAYMPDMVYSVAYETYGPSQQRLAASAKAKNELSPFYSGIPVPGTIARGDMLPYAIGKDTAGASGIKNPLDIAKIDLKEAERLYLVNCAICHGTKLDGLGPLYGKAGEGPFQAKPADLIGSPMNEGAMFHVATYGKNAMGSYASQLTDQQRWMVVAYVHSKRSNGTGAAGAPGVAADSTGATTGMPAAPDSAAAATPK